MSVPMDTIQEILDTQLLTVVDESLLQKENTVRSSKTENFIRSTLLPSQTIIGSLGQNGYDVLSGLMQIDVFTKTGIGTTQGNQIVDTILDAYIKGTVLELDGVEVIIENKWRIPGRTLQNFYSIPIFVQYSVYSQPDTV